MNNTLRMGISCVLLLAFAACGSDSDDDKGATTYTGPTTSCHMDDEDYGDVCTTGSATAEDCSSSGGSVVDACAANPLLTCQVAYDPSSVMLPAYNQTGSINFYTPDQIDAASEAGGSLCDQLN